MQQIFNLLNSDIKRNACNAIMQAPASYRCEIKERTRTLDQNAKLWAMLTEVSKQLQWQVNGELTYLTPSEWKDIFTASLNQETNRIAKGLRGGYVMLGLSTSKMTKSQMIELIEFISAFCAEQGVKIDVQE
ncbi:recombination protein NinB [Taylorella asinigenitalis]|nr:recombination protein NinB [Taylorella asinigenitalis]